MIKKLVLIFVFIITTTASSSAESVKCHHEASYQNAWCSAHNGIVEFENKDCIRVECLTATHAVEFDFANKWAEGIGQFQKPINFAIKTNEYDSNIEDYSNAPAWAKKQANKYIELSFRYLYST